MRIASLEVLTLHYAYPEEERIRCAEGAIDMRCSSLVRLRTDEGREGIGSAYSHPDIVRTVVEGHLAPFLVGTDPLEIDALWDRMYSLTRWYGRRGAAISALGAVDVALWDLRGKAEDAPVYRLLGGTRPEVSAYASGLLWQDDLASLAAEAVAHADAGFRLVKMRIGRDPGYDRAAVEAVTDALEGRAQLAVDGTHRYTPEAAVELSALLCERDVAWFEEPFPPEDAEAYARLRAQVGVPVAAGENEFGVEGFRELFRIGAVDVAQPDVSRAGGISECRRIARLAEDAGVRIATHGWSDAVAVTANAHLLAAIPNVVGVEVDRTGTPLMDRLLREPLELRDGKLVLTDRPGLGIELDEDVVRQLSLPGGEAIRDGNYGDLVFGNRPYDSVPRSAASRGGLP